MQTFGCPVCRGRIALWVVRPNFTCPSCGWWLKSNIDNALNRSVVSGLVAELLLLLVLRAALGDWSQALNISLLALGGAGLIAGSFALKGIIVLTPVKRLPR